MQTATAGGMARRVQNVQFSATNLDQLAVGQRVINPAVGVDDLPQHRIIRMQEDWRPRFVGEIGCGVDVVVVTMGANNRPQCSAAEAIENGAVVVGGVDDDGLVVVADDPDVVLDLAPRRRG